jgi:hypothetical protein
MQIELIKPHNKQKQIISELLNPDMFLILAVIGRQFGKTCLAENMAIFWSINNPNTTIFWVSPTDSQAQKVYKEIVNAIIGSGCIKSKKMPKGDTEIVFHNGSKILFRSAMSEDSLRGQSVDYMILDEAAFIKKDVFDTILLPMLSVRGKKCFICTTPKGKNWIYEYYLKANDILNWKSFRFSTYDSPYANADIINMFKETLPDKLFRQEIEAEFVDSSSIFNNIGDIMCLNKTISPIPGETYYAGVDIGLINDASVLSILNSDGDVVNYFRWTDIESPDLINEILKLNNIWKFNVIGIESNNQGLTIFQELKRKIKNIIDINTNQKTKPEMINRLVHLFNMREIKMIKDDYLKIEFESFIFKQMNNGAIKFMADYGFHDDCVMSVAVAREVYTQYQKRKFNAKATTIFIPTMPKLDNDW